MNEQEHLLVCLAEECAEIQQAVSKALRFGLDDGYPGADTTNAEDIAREIIELSAVVDLCKAQDVFPQAKEAHTIYSAKQKRIYEYMQYARETGALED